MAKVMAVSDEDYEKLWQAARRASDNPSDRYAQGAFDMIQVLSGNDSVATVLDNLEE